MDNIIFRGTTPTIFVDCPFDADSLGEAYLTIQQLGRTVIEKTLQDFRREGKDLAVTLSQEETLLLNDKYAAEAQVTLKSVSGTVITHEPVSIRVGRSLKGVVI